jgi:UDP-GlcNAc:undecaprenyl-phosphate GlcNAc-1-phosphate transferase
VAVIVAFAVAAVVAPLTAAIARRLDIVDRPGAFKVHDEPVPYLGGVAVYVALAIPVALERPALLVPLGMACAVGLADDVHDVPARARLVLATLVALAVVAVVPVRGAGGALLTVAFVLILLNAVNLLDGLDGLAPGVGVMSAIGFAVVLDDEYRVLALALAGALGGFLLWNRPPARQFLGDAGSYLLGTTLALLLAVAFGRGEPVEQASAALLFVGVPAADTAVAIVRRFRARRPLLQGDRGHVYDQLVDRGWPPTTTTIACIAAQGVLTAAGIAIATFEPSVAVAATAAIVLAVAAIAISVFTSPASWSR